LPLKINQHICGMSIRQEKFASLLQQELAAILMEKRAEYFENAFITITKVMVSPDLGHAKVYLSMLQVNNKEELLNIINFHNKHIRQELAAKIRKQVRIIPELAFYIDDSLDYVFHMEKVFKDIKDKEGK
jgi:ribosome-binding factor A